MIKNTAEAKRLAKLSVKKRKATKPPEYWSKLAKSGAKARWKDHKKISTPRKRVSKKAAV